MPVIYLLRGTCLMILPLLSLLSDLSVGERGIRVSRDRPYPGDQSNQRKMFIYISIVLGLVMIRSHRVSGSPYAKLQAVSQLPPLANLSLSMPEAPAASNLSRPPYTCYDPAPSRIPITVDDCREALRIIRGMPNYRRVQEFERKRKPLIPVEGTREFRAPPFLIAPDDTKCALEINDILPGYVDKFSWLQVKELGQDIIEECNSPGKPGYGGQSHIGENNRWKIRIFGISDDSDDPPTNITSLPELFDDIALITNATMVPGPLDDANTTITMPVPTIVTGETS